VIEDATADSLEALRFVDLDRSVVERELARMAGDRRSGPSAENVLRDLRAVASGSV
jgi:pyruvate ferredoxin oxidoreductase alpha subunit